MSSILCPVGMEVKPREAIREIPMSEVRLSCRDAVDRYRLRREVAPVQAAREQLERGVARHGLALTDNEATRIAVAVVLAYLREV